MRHFANRSAESYAVGVVEVARWEQYELGDILPFQAMWYTVPAGASSPQDRHPEVELSVVISGTAFVEASGAVTEVGAGDAFLLGSDEAHIIHNRSAGTPLLVFTTYWMPREAPVGAATASGGGLP
jgi:quercetin dioxygenase-like cupin family protein